MSRWRTLMLVGLVGTLVAACTPGSQAAPGQPPALVTLQDAETTAREFLTAWTTGNFQVMYGLVSPRSRIIPEPVFTETYAQVDKALGLAKDQGKSFELLTEKSQRQGSTAIIHYDMTFDTPALGKFTDMGRVMRLIVTQQGRGQAWRVAWSQMDIFEGMAGGAQLARRNVLPRRGTIFDRNGQPIAQGDVDNYVAQLYTISFPTGNPDDCYWALEQVFRINVAEARQTYNGYAGLQYAFTIGTLREDELSRYRSLLDSNCTMLYKPQRTRSYVNNGIGAQTVGFVGPILAEQRENYPNYPDGALVGQIGIEAAYEARLAGEPGSRLVIVSPDGIIMRVLASKESGLSQDVTTTLDIALQTVADAALANAYNNANWARLSPGAAAVVLNVQTGEVLAMASYPTVNPDAFPTDTSQWPLDTISKYQQSAAFTNRVTERTYAPASVFKIVSMAAALGTGTFTPRSKFTCDGLYIDPEGLRREDWIYTDPVNGKNFHGELTLVQALSTSCDDYFWHIGEELYNKVSANTLREYANMMGLGVPTGIVGVPEEAGVIPDPDYKRRNTGEAWGVGDTLNEVIGQGNVQVNVLQIARMMMTVANDGRPYRPYLIRSAGYPGSAPLEFVAPEVSGEIKLTADQLRAIKQGMCTVTTDLDFGTAARTFAGFPVDQIAVCGKTGTSQNDPGSPPNAWFAAYAGRAGRAPEIAVAVFVERSREGSEVAAPIVRRIIEGYYGLAYAAWPEWWYGEYIPVPIPGQGSGNQ